MRTTPIALFFALAACGGSSRSTPSSGGNDALPLGTAIARSEGTAIGTTGWRWIPFPDTNCTDAVEQESGAYEFSISSTGLAISWGPEGSTDVVVFLQGGGACWSFTTCGGAGSLGFEKTAATGPFGPLEFERGIFDRYPSSWIRRENLPPSLRDATIAFIPYCTGDVHSGERITTYTAPGFPPITWHHVGHANVLAFMGRLAATFRSPRRVVIAGTSAGGFGSLSNYPTFRRYWPAARAYLVDDSGPPLAGQAIPEATRDAWYANWNIGVTLDPFCPSCPGDMSNGLRELTRRYPSDRIALLSYVADPTIRAFFGTFTLAPPSVTPMPATEFEGALRSLGTDVMGTTENARYFFTSGEGHSMILDPTSVTSPVALEEWLELMLSDSPRWESVSDP